MKLRDLLEQRSRAIAEMRALTDNPKGQDGDLSDEQASRFDTLKRDVAQLEQRIDPQRTLDEAERRMQGERITEAPTTSGPNAAFSCSVRLHRASSRVPRRRA